MSVLDEERGYTRTHIYTNTHKTHRHVLRQGVEVDVVGQLDVPHVDAEQLLAALLCHGMDG